MAERTDQRSDAFGLAPRETRPEPRDAGQAGPAWGSMLFGPREVERLVDRLSVALQTQTQLVRELDDSRALLAARQAEVEAARRKAERSAETLSTFLHALGHDLRAPFTSIGAGLELLALESDSPDASSRAERIGSLARTAAYGLSMVDDLFELLRSDAGQWRVDLRDHALEDLVRDAISLVSPRATAKGLALRVEWSGDGQRSLRLRTDGMRVRQALSNILGNAVKFSDAGEVVLRAAIEREGPREWLLLSVCDSGPGFDPLELAAVFEPFRQSARTGRRAQQGAGLGLAIVARCASLLGGSAAAANNGAGDDARGACVSLRLPLERAAIGAPLVEGCAERADASTAPSDATAFARVLLVEDAPESRRLAEHHFARAGCLVRSVETLAAARATLAREPFDLVVVDGELPDGHGTDLLADLAAQAHGAMRPPPLVVSSARVERGSAALPGVFDTLPKPISRDSVAALLARLGARRVASEPPPASGA